MIRTLKLTPIEREGPVIYHGDSDDKGWTYDLVTDAAHEQVYLMIASF